MTEAEALVILQEAMASPFGVAVPVPTDLEKVRQKFYIARANSGDPSLAELSIRVSPRSPQTELWIVKAKEAKNA